MMITRQAQSLALESTNGLGLAFRSKEFLHILHRESLAGNLTDRELTGVLVISIEVGASIAPGLDVDLAAAIRANHIRHCIRFYTFKIEDNILLAIFVGGKF